MSVYFRGIQDLIAVDWGGTHLWDIKFEGAPAPFDSWFPAIEVEYPKYEMSHYTLNISGHELDIPFRGKTNGTVSITFVDDKSDTITDWLNEWFESIHRHSINSVNRFTVATLAESSRVLYIADLDHDRNILGDRLVTLEVFPTGSVRIKKENESNNKIYTSEFVITKRY